MTRFRYYGSGRRIIQLSVRTGLPVFAGVFLKEALPIADPLRSAFFLTLAIILILVSAAYSATTGWTFKPQQNSPSLLSQMMLEKLWTDFRAKMISEAAWSADVHLRFVVYIPLRLMWIGPSFLIPVHYLDSDEQRNKAEFSISVRTRVGWAGRVFRDGHPYAADLDQTGSLLGLYLTEKQIYIVRDVLKLRSKICVPMTLEYDDRIYGVFCIESCSPMSETRFDQDTVFGEVKGLARPVLQVCRTAYWLREHQTGG